LWSLLGHLGLLAGALVYGSLPSQVAPSRQGFFVRLAGPASPPPGRGGGASAAPVTPAEPIERAAPAERETVVSHPNPSKASLPAEKIVKTAKPSTPTS